MNEAWARNRDKHADLDSRIVSLLPRALPPVSPSPTTFALGILPFAYVFNAIEEEWQNLKERPGGESGGIRKALAETNIEGLLRSRLFREDLEQLQVAIGIQCDQSCTAAQDQRFLSSHELDSFLDHFAKAFQKPGHVSRNDIFRANSLTSRVHAVVQEKPHLLIAHIYIWYMAVLSGGRYLIYSLREVPNEFWGLRSEGNAGFSFLNSNPHQKVELRRHLRRWERLLSEEKMNEVLAETDWVYEVTMQLVESLESTLNAVG